MCCFACTFTHTHPTISSYTGARTQTLFIFVFVSASPFVFMYFCTYCLCKTNSQLAGEWDGRRGREENSNVYENIANNSDDEKRNDPNYRMYSDVTDIMRKNPMSSTTRS